MCDDRTYYIGCSKDRIAFFLIDNISNRLLGVVLLRIIGLFVILLDCDVDDKTIIGISIINIIDENNGLIIKFLILNYNCIFE